MAIILNASTYNHEISIKCVIYVYAKSKRVSRANMLAPLQCQTKLRGWCKFASFPGIGLIYVVDLSSGYLSTVISCDQNGLTWLTTQIILEVLLNSFDSFPFLFRAPIIIRSSLIYAHPKIPLKIDFIVSL